jgi:hypothetical protein
MCEDDNDFQVSTIVLVKKKGKTIIVVFFLFKIKMTLFF